MIQFQRSTHGLFPSINIARKVLDLRLFSVIKNSAGFILHIKYKVGLFKEIIIFCKNFLNTEITINKDTFQWHICVRNHNPV